MTGKVVSINISQKKGERKKPIEKIEIRENYGLVGDAHASSKWHRQVSLLAMESISKMVAQGLDVGPGDFAENITTQGLNLISLPIGTKIKIGEEIQAEVSQIGKECHTPCAIFYQAGFCVMPKEGIFVSILKGGIVRKGDSIEVILD